MTSATATPPPSARPWPASYGGQACTTSPLTRDGTGVVGSGNGMLTAPACCGDRHYAKLGGMEHGPGYEFCP